MEYMNDGQNYIVRIDKDENLFEKLIEFAKKENLTSGHISGIGALKDVELGFYHLDKLEYHKKKFTDDYELLGLEGNLSHMDGEPFFHIHATLGDSEFKAFGGHVFDATVAVTCEVNFRVFDELVERKLNSCIGLKHLELRRI
ncbi:PF03479 domain protein [Bacteriovorax sp. BSW11_IV]|uniref:PPC domain-containing DNA-binding protein n=1 Tax=Bacteriovorax sp. BSW11_IV TaxID=1353529 RepID=UPI00038A515F|nr:PPC domain-containing DNA-binding protein [Bacteriovorax sp. BSW11_IV]EQC48875.1 PF03479 domain protein [Bacteriovorax sp. BSW11_IV]